MENENDTAPDTVELTETERLRLENLNLKRTLVLKRIAEGRKVLADLEAEDETINGKFRALAEETSARLGVEIKRYFVNVDTGIGTLTAVADGDPDPPALAVAK